jgi:hypothetical protein
MKKDKESYSDRQTIKAKLAASDQPPTPNPPARNQSSIVEKSSGEDESDGAGFPDRAWPRRKMASATITI